MNPIGGVKIIWHWITSTRFCVSRTTTSRAIKCLLGTPVRDDARKPNFRIISNVRPEAENHTAEVTVWTPKDVICCHVLLEWQVRKFEAGMIELSRKS